MRIILIISLAIILAYCGIAMADSPGINVGTTYYDCQGVFSSGNKMAVGGDGSKYFFWTNGLNYPTPRYVYYNYVSANGTWFEPGVGVQATNLQSSGFVQVALDRNNQPFFAYDWPTGLGQYHTIVVDGRSDGQHSFPPDTLRRNNDTEPIRRCLWPQIAIDRNGIIYVVMTEATTFPDGNPGKLCYAYSTDNDYTWIPSNSPAVIDSVRHPSARIATSPVSDKVVIAYQSPIDTVSPLTNEVSYVMFSERGRDDLITRTNITDYRHSNDSLWAFWDLDVIFDYNDNFHVVWTAQKIGPYQYYIIKSYLYHYNSGTGQINEIHHWPETAWSSDSVKLGSANLPICKMNLGEYHGATQDAIFLTWTQFNANDCSADSFFNGDIFMSYSVDGGSSWSAPSNLTNSISNGCLPGTCDNDNWASLADIVDDSLHIFYLDDKDAGSIVYYEGVATENPMKYLAIPNPLVTGVADETRLPNTFSFDQNYPNPFNSSTMIRYNLPTLSPVTIAIYDILGRKVQTLIEGTQPAGDHQVIWQARNIPSGMYYCKLTAGNFSQTRKMILMK